MIQDASDTLCRHRSALLDAGHAEWHCWESWEIAAQAAGGEMDSCCEHRLLPILAGLVLLIVDLVVLKMQKIYMHIYICIHLYVCVCMYTPPPTIFPFVPTWIYLAWSSSSGHALQPGNKEAGFWWMLRARFSSQSTLELQRYSHWSTRTEQMALFGKRSVQKKRDFQMKHPLLTVCPIR